MDKNQDKNRRLVFYNFVEENGRIWFWDINYNALFHGSIEGGIAERVWAPDNEGEAVGPMYGKVVKYGSKIIGVPMCSDKIMIYDMAAKETRFVSIPTLDWGNEHTLKRGRFWEGVVYGDYVIMIGYWSAKVLRFDAVNESVDDVIDLYEELDVPYEKRTLSFKNALLIKSKILIPSYVTNCIFSLNPNNMQFEKVLVKKTGHGFSDIAYDGEEIWLSPREPGHLVRWNFQENNISLNDNYPPEFHMEAEANIAGMEYCNGRVYVFPYKANKAISVQKRGNNIGMDMENKFNYYYDSLCTHNEVMKYLFVQSMGKQLYSYSTDSRELLSYDTERRLLSVYKFLISEEECLRINLRKWNVVSEEQSSLNLFINMLLNNDKKDV